MPTIRIDPEIAECIERDRRTLTSHNLVKKDSAIKRKVSANSVLRIWLGLDKPRAGVKRKISKSKLS